MSGSEEQSIKPRLAIVGGVLTIMYLALLATYVVLDRHEFWAMKASDIASFLSGSFSPLAFLWLVLGFLQQGVELRHSARALYLQQEELRNSVEQQQALVTVTREQLQMEREARRVAEVEIDRASRPRLVLRSSGSSSSGLGRAFHYTLENLGTPCANVEVNTKPRKEHFEVGALRTGDELNISLFYQPDELTVETEVVVSFRDARGLLGDETFLLPIKELPDGPPVYGKPILMKEADQASA